MNGLFYGEYEVKVEDSGRVTIPAEYKSLLDNTDQVLIERLEDNKFRVKPYKEKDELEILERLKIGGLEGLMKHFSRYKIEDIKKPVGRSMKINLSPRYKGRLEAKISGAGDCFYIEFHKRGLTGWLRKITTKS